MVDYNGKNSEMPKDKEGSGNKISDLLKLFFKMYIWLSKGNSIKIQYTVTDIYTVGNIYH